jgi:hypothetical protein
MDEGSRDGPVSDFGRSLRRAIHFGSFMPWFKNPPNMDTEHSLYNTRLAWQHYQSHPVKPSVLSLEPAEAYAGFHLVFFRAVWSPSLRNPAEARRIIQFYGRNGRSLKKSSFTVGSIPLLESKTQVWESRSSCSHFLPSCSAWHPQGRIHSATTTPFTGP